MTTLLLGFLLAQATQSGVTVMGWDVGSAFDGIPNVVTGQAPNSYFIAGEMAWEGGLTNSYGDLSQNFVGELKSRVQIATAGQYAFRLESGSHADLRVQGEFVTSTLDRTLLVREGVAEGRYQLARGSASLRVRFVHGAGKFSVRLKWRPPGTTEFVPIPKELLSTEPGQTFVTSPGVKKANLGKPTTAPGDGRPLEAVHPSFDLVNFRGNFTPAVGGMCFLPDGRLAVCTWDERGSVYLISGLETNRPTVKLFADGLGEPLGIAYWRGDLYVTQKGEVTRLRDRNGDGTVDQFETIASGWPVSQNYHEFTFNLVPFQGSFYVSSSVPLRSGVTNYMPGTHGSMPISDGPGSWIKIHPQTGKWERLATGLRTPNGMAIGVDGHMYSADNQGSWLPSSPMYILRPGAKYLHQEVPTGDPSFSNLVVWFPHGEVGNSPSEMTLIPDGAYRGQMLIGDVTHGGLKRVALEKVDGEYQGTVFRHSQGLEAGINRLAWGPDGSLYVGGIGSNGNWNHLGHKFGLQRLRPNGKLPFEMHSLSARKDGLLVQFTKPLAESAIANLKAATVRQWRYESSLLYGGPKIDDQKLAIQSVSASPDRKQVFLSLAGLKAGHVVYLNLRGTTSDRDEKMWSPEAWYTLGRLPATAWQGFSPLRGELQIARPAGAETLIAAEGKTIMREANGQVSRWQKGNGFLEVIHNPASQIGAADIFSPTPHGDAMVHVEWFSPAGGKLEVQTNGNSGIKLQSRYEIQIMNAPGISDVDHPGAKFNEAGSVYRLTAPKVNASYGAGVWQTYDIWFRAARWEGTKKVEPAKITVYWNGVLVHDDQEILAKTGMSVDEGPNPLPLLLQDHATEAEGGVRYRNVWWVKDPWQKGFLPPK